MSIAPNLGLTDEQLDAAARRDLPLSVLAKRLGVQTIDLTATLRARGSLSEVQAEELQFILRNHGRMPAGEIRDRLNLSRTQFLQICQKTLGLKVRISGDELTLEQVEALTKRLIEEKLGLALDDELPRNISNKHFTDNGLYNCIRFAEKAKTSDSLYRHFSAVAFLLSRTYPELYRPFQFRHAKQNGFFKGPDGKQNLVNAVRWVMEHKLEYEPEHVPILAHSNSFLPNAVLQFFGLGPHWYRLHFASKDELIREVLSHYTEGEPSPRARSTARLRATLASASRPVHKCEVAGCYYDDEFGLDVHHVIPRAAPVARTIDLHGAHNLVALCPNHHRVAHAFEWKALDVSTPEDWRPALMAFIVERPARPEPAAS